MAACRKHAFSDKISSRRAGILAIRMFECINRVTFDPLNTAHVDRVTGMGPPMAFAERLKEIWS